MWVRFGIASFLIGSMAGVACAQEGSDKDWVNASYTWIHWWETNRDSYLRKIIEQNPVADSSAARTQAAEKAKAALIELTRSPSANLRAEAGLALARMDAGGAQLVELTHDASLRVRCRGWIGLGLLQEEDELLKRKDLPDVDETCVMAAIALLDKPSATTLLRVRSEARSAKSDAVRRMAVRTLRILRTQKRIDATDDGPLFFEILRQSDDPTLITEDLLALSSLGSSSAVDALLDIGDAGAAAQKLPSIQRAFRERSKIAFCWNYDILRAVAFQGIAQFPRDGDGLDLSAKDPAARERMGRIETLLAKYAFLVPGITIRDKGLHKNIYYPGMATLALGRIGAFDKLNDIVDLNWPGRDAVVHVPPLRGVETPSDFFGLRKVFPQRGYAVFALGDSGQSEQAPTRVGDVNTITPNPQESPYFRSEVLLVHALNKQGVTDNEISESGKQLDPVRDTLICGHIVLALGLTHDIRALDLAARLSGKGATAIDVDKVLESSFDRSNYFLQQPVTSQIPEMQGVLAARAVLLGLAVLGDPKARPILLANWGKDPWVSLEASRAMGWCGVYDGTDALIQLAQQGKQPNVAAWAARCLGEMLDSHQPSHLSRLIEGSCYMNGDNRPGKWQNTEPSIDELQKELCGLGNPYLYWTILPRTSSIPTLPWWY